MRASARSSPRNDSLAERLDEAVMAAVATWRRAKQATEELAEAINLLAKQRDEVLRGLERR